MSETLITIAVIAGFRVAENLINKGVEHSKTTANTWDNVLWDGLKIVSSTFISIFSKKPKT